MTQAIVREGLKNVTAGANPIGIRRGIESAVAVAVDELKAIAQPVANKEAIAQVAAVSSRSEKLVNTFQKLWKSWQRRCYHYRRITWYGNRT